MSTGWHREAHSKPNRIGTFIANKKAERTLPLVKKINKRTFLCDGYVTLSVSTGTVIGMGANVAGVCAMADKSVIEHTGNQKKETVSIFLGAHYRDCHHKNSSVIRGYKQNKSGKFVKVGSTESDVEEENEKGVMQKGRTPKKGKTDIDWNSVNAMLDKNKAHILDGGKKGGMSFFEELIEEDLTIGKFQWRYDELKRSLYKLIKKEKLFHDSHPNNGS